MGADVVIAGRRGTCCARRARGEQVSLGLSMMVVIFNRRAAMFTLPTT
jgi:hypothetical protein